ncbi:MAG: electron transfer flavoprotein subunit alpha/FixB family protein [Cyclobacteriaceae bacterium]|nr:electron transfer flavoprotein subunit alpha/FixB family protein [Cyclobacteriaceae bacterium]
MSVIVFVENSDSGLKGVSAEAIIYARKLSEEVNVLAVGTKWSEDTLKGMGKFGAKKVWWANDPIFDHADSLSIAGALKDLIDKSQADIIVVAHTSLGASVAAMVSVKIQGSLATSVTGLPDTTNGFVVERSIFTGKAFEKVTLLKGKKILAIKKNAVSMIDYEGVAAVEVYQYSASSPESGVKVTGEEKMEGDILLSDAEIVVSAGRGLKGPENWGMVEELAKTLKAATACSKPVSDMEWRPHHEHVGQTGIKVAPQLYIAIGISGAIQHLAGVNSSKCIVVINKDPEAPFFKEADYGIVGDAFEVVPKLNEALKKL